MNRSVCPAGFLQFFHMTAKGWPERGSEDSLFVRSDVALDLLDRFRQLLDQSSA
jgi:hypothetical protein